MTTQSQHPTIDHRASLAVRSLSSLIKCSQAKPTYLVISSDPACSGLVSVAIFQGLDTRRVSDCSQVYPVYPVTRIRTSMNRLRIRPKLLPHPHEVWRHHEVWLLASAYVARKCPCGNNTVDGDLSQMHLIKALFSLHIGYRKERQLPGRPPQKGPWVIVDISDLLGRLWHKYRWQ